MTKDNVTLHRKYSLRAMFPDGQHIELTRTFTDRSRAWIAAADISIASYVPIALYRYEELQAVLVRGSDEKDEVTG